MKQTGNTAPSPLPAVYGVPAAAGRWQRRNGRLLERLSLARLAAATRASNGQWRAQSRSDARPSNTNPQRSQGRTDRQAQYKEPASLLPSHRETDPPSPSSPHLSTLKISAVSQFRFSPPQPTTQHPSQIERSRQADVDCGGQIPVPGPAGEAVLRPQEERRFQPLQARRVPNR